MRLRGLSWLLLVGATGCGSKAPTAIVVSIGAPQLVPAVIDRFTVDAGRAGEAASFHRAYAITADASLPGTLTIVPRDAAANAPVSFRVSGALGVGGGEVISRSARLGFVDGKTKLLRLTLEQACVGKVCVGDQTCIAGACVAPDVDAATLPDFVDRDDALRPVGSAGGAAGASGTAGGGTGGAGSGGGGSGGGGGAGSGGGGSGGAGSGGGGSGGGGSGGAGSGGGGSGGGGSGGAGSGGAGSGGGGSGGAGSGGAGSGGAAGAAPYACSHPASVEGLPLDGVKCDPCARLVCSTLPACCTTAWDAGCVSAAKQGCGAAATGVTLADSLGSVKDLAVDGADVFWITDRLGTATNFELIRAARAVLGGPTTVLDNGTGMFALALSSDEVFYRAGSEMRRIKKSGGTALPFFAVTGVSSFLHVGGGRVFWGDNVIRYDDLPALAGPTKSFASVRATLMTYEPTGASLYWTDRPLGGGFSHLLYRAKVPDGAPEVLLTFATPSTSSANSVAANATHLYFSDGLAGKVQRCVHADCANTVELLWSLAGANPQRIVLDGSRLYWNNHDVTPQPDSGGVYSCDVADCANTTKSYLGQDKVQGLAVDDLFVYWGTQATTGGTTTGLIRRAPK